MMSEEEYLKTMDFQKSKEIIIDILSDFMGVNVVEDEDTKKIIRDSSKKLSDNLNKEIEIMSILSFNYFKKEFEDLKQSLQTLNQNNGSKT